MTTDNAPKGPAVSGWRGRACVLVAVIASCSTPVAAPGSASPSAAPSATVAATPTVAAAASTPAVNLANQALLARVRETGRTGVAICLYVDPATGVDAGAALTQLQSSIDALVQQGYAGAASRAALCPQPPLFVRTNTVHPKNSGNGPVAAAPRVTTPSPYLLFFAVTPTARIATIFGGLTLRRGTEEITCTGDNCRGVTESIYTDASAYADAALRERLLQEGLGLLGA